MTQTKKHRIAHKVRVLMTEYPPDLYTAVAVGLMREGSERVFTVVPGRVVALPNVLQLAQGFHWVFVEVGGGAEDIELTWNEQQGAAFGRLGAQSKRR